MKENMLLVDLLSSSLADSSEKLSSDFWPEI